MSHKGGISMKIDIVSKVKGINITIRIDPRTLIYIGLCPPMHHRVVPSLKIISESTRYLPDLLQGRAGYK